MGSFKERILGRNLPAAAGKRSTNAALGSGSFGALLYDVASILESVTAEHGLPK